MVQLPYFVPIHLACNFQRPTEFVIVGAGFRNLVVQVNDGFERVFWFCRIKFLEAEIGYADRFSKESVMHHA